jgi:hypothetical protein
MWRTIKCLSIFMCLIFLMSCKLVILFFFAMLWFLYQICVLSTIATKYLTKNRKNPSILSDFLCQTSLPDFCISVSIISTGLSVKPVSAILKFENQNFNRNSIDIYGFHDIRRNRWPLVFGPISIL